MPSPPRRPSLRLPTYDYTQPGGYFVTICTQHRICRFGNVSDGQMHLDEAGQMVEAVWHELPMRFPHISLDASIVMPNHLHGIILIQEEQRGQSLGRIVGAFKSLTTNRYIVGVREQHWHLFPGKLWQDNYFEHIIRDEEALDGIREYIVGNPATWERDPEHPGG